MPAFSNASSSWVTCSAACGKSRIRTASGRCLSVKVCERVRSIHHGTDLLGLPHLAPPYLSFRLIDKGGSIREPRKIGEMAHMDLSLSIGGALLLWFADGHRARFCPLFLHQRNHGSISTKGTTLRCWLIVGFLRRRSIAFLCLGSFHVRSHAQSRVGAPSPHWFAHPGALRSSGLLCQKASNWRDALGVPVVEERGGLGATPTPHKGGKKTLPTLGAGSVSSAQRHTLSSISRHAPAFACLVRGLGTAQVGHNAAGCPDVFPHSRLGLSCAASWRICASSSIIRLCTSSSICTYVAVGCARRHSFTSVRISTLFSRQACSSIFGPSLSVVFQMALSYHFSFTWTILGARILGAPFPSQGTTRCSFD
jgi:hypothetical protein